MATIVIKQEDTYPFIEAFLEAENAAIDLTNAKEVTLLAKLKAGSTEWTGKCKVAEPKTEGRVIYEQRFSDFGSLGEYELEYKIEWNSGKIQHVPNEGVFTVEVVKRVP